jgi:hypothetical protein
LNDPLNIINFQDMCHNAGCCFAKVPLEKFIADNHLNLLARAHQCVSDGNYIHGVSIQQFLAHPVTVSHFRTKANS